MSARVGLWVKKGLREKINLIAKRMGISTSTLLSKCVEKIILDYTEEQERNEISDKYIVEISKWKKEKTDIKGLNEPMVAKDYYDKFVKKDSREDCLVKVSITDREANEILSTYLNEKD